jgi:hypothetical protein
MATHASQRQRGGGDGRAAADGGVASGRHPRPSTGCPPEDPSPHGRPSPPWPALKDPLQACGKPNY